MVSKSAAAVDVDAAAFEDDAAAFVDRLPEAPLQFFVGLGNDNGVFFVIGVFGPAVEAPMGVGDFAGRILYADRAGVAHPAAIGGDAEEIDGGEVGAGFFQDGADTGFGGAIFDEEINALDLGEMADDFGEGPRNGSRICRASRLVRAASLAKWLRAVPIRRACGNPGEPGSSRFASSTQVWIVRRCFLTQRSWRAQRRMNHSPSQRFRMG